jgi:hypothetical protein
LRVERHVSLDVTHLLVSSWTATIRILGDEEEPFIEVQVAGDTFNKFGRSLKHFVSPMLGMMSISLQVNEIEVDIYEVLDLVMSKLNEQFLNRRFLRLVGITNNRIVLNPNVGWAGSTED